MPSNAASQCWAGFLNCFASSNETAAIKQETPRKHESSMVSLKPSEKGLVKKESVVSLSQPKKMRNSISNSKIMQLNRESIVSALQRPSNLPLGWFQISESTYFNFGTLLESQQFPVLCQMPYASNGASYEEISRFLSGFHSKNLYNLMECVESIDWSNIKLPDFTSLQEVKIDQMNLKILFYLLKKIIITARNWKENERCSYVEFLEKYVENSQPTKQKIKSALENSSDVILNTVMDNNPEELVKSFLEIFKILLLCDMVSPCLELADDTCGKLTVYVKKFQEQFVSLELKEANKCVILFPAVVRRDDQQLFHKSAVVTID